MAPYTHLLKKGDARRLSFLEDDSIHLVVTSPPYWILKEYLHSPGQLSDIESYDSFLSELNRVWGEVYRTLIPGGRLAVVVGDVLLSRRKHKRHRVMPLHADIQVACRKIGFDVLSPIIWYKISNINYEIKRGNGFLGKPYEPNAIIKNDIEYILLFRKPGPYRSPTSTQRELSRIKKIDYQQWFQQIWTNIPGTRVKGHPAPFPLEIANRLIRMFSFVEDTVLDPFVGSGTTSLAAVLTNRNSIGVDIESSYLELAYQRILKAINERDLASKHKILIENTLETLSVNSKHFMTR